METKADKFGRAASGGLRVEFNSEVLRQIRQHARSSMDAEICGVLIGEARGGLTRVTARIEGEGASQGGAHVTFTHATWDHIYRVKDSRFPSASIVGWYHSHPGFGVFLSDYDLFIHRNFFNEPHQLAWVFDPHSDEEGCFGWKEGKVERLGELIVLESQQKPSFQQELKAISSQTIRPTFMHRLKMWGANNGEIFKAKQSFWVASIGVLLILALGGILLAIKYKRLPKHSQTEVHLSPKEPVIVHPPLPAPPNKDPESSTSDAANNLEKHDSDSPTSSPVEPTAKQPK